jgi:hypothetical protein
MSILGTLRMLLVVDRKGSRIGERGNEREKKYGF